MTFQRAKWIAPAALFVVVFLWSMLRGQQNAPRVRSAPAGAPLPIVGERNSPSARVEDLERRDAGSFEMPPPAPDATALAPARAPASERVLLRATFGDEPHQLGLLEPGEGFDGLVYPPQGFVSLPGGRLLVLDTAKKRLVWFGADGHMERAMPLPADLLLPADVVITRDGTIVVVDHEGVETSGTVMLDDAGNVKARLPQLNALMTDAYAVGNQVFFSSGGVLNSVKAGDTSGSASDETPGVFNQNGVVPGRVAPDGRTVVNASIVRGDPTQLLVSAVTGDMPEHLFSRVYAVGEELRSISSVQVDGKGIIYVIVRLRGRRTLACFEGKSGEPVGHVLLPRDRGDGMPFSPFVVPESGGLVMQQLQPGGVAYHFIDCRP